MGWNRGYSIYEEQVVKVYDTGAMTPEVLKAIIAPFGDTDLDHGGSGDLPTKDGLSADEVVVKLLSPKFWAKYEPLRSDWNDPIHNDHYNEWRKIMRL